MQLKDIPEEVRDNHYINTYTVTDEQERVVFQAKRHSHSNDIRQVMDDQVIKVPGRFYGEWYDTTKEAKAKQKPKNQSKEPTNTKSELERAEELLAKLKGGI